MTLPELKSETPVSLFLLNVLSCNTMNTIEVPYLPISNFDSFSVSKNFPIAEDEKSSSLMPSVGRKPDGDLFSDEIELILHAMGMEKYIKLFKNGNVLLDTFLQLNETDLIELGIGDQKDREIIINNLSIHQESTNNCIVPENHVEDLQIMKNIYHQVLLLQNYCAYMELQMKKHKLTDYRINTEESACTYLRAFTESALIQSEIMCNTIYGEQNFNSLIDKLLQTNNLDLPKALQKLLPKRKRKYKISMFPCITAIGLCFVTVLIQNYFVRK